MMQGPENSDNSGFVQIREAFANMSVINTLQSFTMGQIATYFVEAIAADKQPAFPEMNSLRCSLVTYF